MKVEMMYELKKIIEFGGYKFSWKDLCSFQEDELQVFMQEAYLKHPNIYCLFQFYLIINDVDNKDWEKEFEHLQMSVDDIKTAVANKILRAKTVEKANDILEYFDYDLKLFQTKEEWSTFLSTIPATEKQEMYLKNLDFALELYQEDRCELIRELSRYHEEIGASNILQFSKKKDSLSEYSVSEFLTFVKLLAWHYHPKDTLDLCNRWHDEQDSEAIQKAEDFLLDDYTPQYVHFPQLFISADYDQYADIAEVAQQLLGFDSYQTLLGYTKLDVPASFKTFLRGKIKEIIAWEGPTLFLDTGEPSNLDGLGFLFSSGYLEKQFTQEENLDLEEISDQIDLIASRLAHAMKESKADVFTALLKRLPFDSWRNISVEADQRVLEFISGNMPYFIEQGLVLKEDESTYQRIAQLSQLSFEANHKFADLLSKSCFLELEDERKEKIISILLSKEAEPSFDYIYNQFQNMEALCKERIAQNEQEQFPQVELATVIELLDSGYDLEDVLDGFQKDDDVQLNTLVRSMKYKKTT